MSTQQLTREEIIKRIEGYTGDLPEVLKVGMLRNKNVDLVKTQVNQHIYLLYSGDELSEGQYAETQGLITEWYNTSIIDNLQTK